MSSPAWVSRHLLIALLLAGAWNGIPAHGQSETAAQSMLRGGDLLFQHIGGEQGEALQLATGSQWTHVGIAFQENGQWMVLEAVGPVKSTSLAEWIEQGKGDYAVKRLVDAEKRLNADALLRLGEAAKPYMGRGYDWRFEWHDELIYCSELVWKVYQQALGIRLCEPKPMREFDLRDPLVRHAMRVRYGSVPPLDEPMMAPSTLFDCPLLVSVVPLK